MYLRPRHIELLWSELQKAGWERVEELPGEEWWAERHWIVRRWRSPAGVALVLTFLVDPMVEDERWLRAIALTPQIPTDRLAAEEHAVMELDKGWKHRLPQLIRALEEHAAPGHGDTP